MEKTETLGISHILTLHLEADLDDFGGATHPCSKTRPPSLHPSWAGHLHPTCALGLLNIVFKPVFEGSTSPRRHKPEALFSRSWLWQSCQTTSALWSHLCNNEYLTSGAPGLLESGQRA